MADFHAAYSQYTSDTESPKFYHRWCSLFGIGALLSRNIYFQHGHFTVYPNMYCMLLGDAGTRKGAAIKMMKKLMVEAGYTAMAADKTSKEKFLLDMLERSQGGSPDDILEHNLFGTGNESNVTECCVMLDEFNDFLGNGNIEFLSMLGSLWDYNGIYESRIKTGKSVAIPNPTVSVLGGNTPTGFATAFPAEIFGQGFFSRLVIIHGSRTGRKISFPRTPDPKETAALVEVLVAIRSKCVGNVQFTSGAESLLDKIYQTWPGMEDTRFASYANRRFTHLLKLCLCVCASYVRTVLTEDDVILANTILTHTENRMHKALGEFGKAKNSDVAHHIMVVLEQTVRPLTIKDIWKEVHTNLRNMQELGEIMNGLREAEKVQYIGKLGFLPKKKVVVEPPAGMVDFNLLSKEEKDY
jgi:hypothetical protein